MEKKILFEEIDGQITFKNTGFTRMEIIGILKVYLEVLVKDSINNTDKNIVTP